MAEVSVSERRIHPIQDAAARGNWKQALQLCDKWSKKGEKSDQFLALKATVLLKQPDRSQQERGEQEVIQLCNRDPAVTNIDAIEKIQDALRNLSLHKQEGPKLWERAIAKNPQNKELLTTWLHNSIAESNWLGAQKAAVALRKAFPKERKYDFWKTLFSYLIQQDSTIETSQRELFGTLAYRFISKAAETVPKDKDQLLSSPEALQTPEELNLLVKIYVNTGRAAEAVQLLSSDSLGLSSRFAIEDPALVLQLLIESYESAQLWDEAFDFCKGHLESEEVSDSVLWELLLTSVRESLYKTELVERAQKLAQQYLSDHRHDRMAYLTALSLVHTGYNADWKLSNVCQQYYENFKAKPFCFEDLRKPVNALDQQERNTFLEMVAKDDLAENPDERLLFMKMKYCFQLGPQAKREELEKLATAALDLYDACRKKSKACPEAGFFAAVALVRTAQSRVDGDVAGNSTRCEVLLQAAMLLESCQKDQKHGEEYYPYLILLVRIQQVLGLMSMAMINFKKLSVKNIQYESAGYMLLNRISTLHPRQFGKITPSQDYGYSPLEHLDLALEMLENAELTLTRQINTGLDYGSYSNINEAIQMRANLQRSINCEIFAYEHLKTRRLSGLLDEGGHPIADYPLVDQRDFSFLQTYEVSGQSPLQYLHVGPLPKERWLDAMSLYDKLFFYMRSELQGHPGTGEKALGLLKVAFEKVDERSQDELGLELTQAELENMSVHKTLTRLITQPKEFVASKKQQTDQNLNHLESWLTGKSSKAQSGCVTVRDFSAPGCEYLHASFTSLETIQGISLFLSAASKKTSKVSKALSIPKETIAKLQALVTAAEAAIHKQAMDIRNTLNEAGVLGKLVDLVTGRNEAGDQEEGIGLAVEKMADGARLETFCGEMKESWVDAVDGILACKVKVFK